MPILWLKANILTVITLLKLFLCVRKLSLSIFLLQYREIFSLMALRMKLQQQFFWEETELDTEFTKTKSQLVSNCRHTHTQLLPAVRSSTSPCFTKTDGSWQHKEEEWCNEQVRWSRQIIIIIINFNKSSGIQTVGACFQYLSELLPSLFVSLYKTSWLFHSDFDWQSSVSVVGQWVSQYVSF